MDRAISGVRAGSSETVGLGVERWMRVEACRAGVGSWKVPGFAFQAKPQKVFGLV